MAQSPRSGRIAGEQIPLDLGLDPPVGRCAWCRQPIRRGEGVTVERPYGFGVCVLSLHRACRQAAGAEGIMRLVGEREAYWARLLGVDRDPDAADSRADRRHVGVRVAPGGRS